MNGRLLMILLLVLFLLLLLPLSAGAEEAESSLYVRKVENLPEDFIFGMDISSVLAEEESGVKYYDFDGKETDLFRLLADNGINMIRVRIWNNPYDDNGNGNRETRNRLRHEAAGGFPLFGFLGRSGQTDGAPRLERPGYR